VGLIALEVDDQAFHLLGELIGIPYRPPRAVVEGLQPVLFVALEYLVAGFT
jgi:hypothetical protein